jgi:hypothetical protein
MPISINGTGTITGISAGGLPDLSITTADIADSAITTAKIAAGAVVPADLSQPMTLGTAVSTSGTAIDFTSIPSWVKRITIMFDQVSTNGSSFPVIQIGDSGGVEALGYNATSSLVFSSPATALYTTSFTIRVDAVSGWVINGYVTLNLLSSSANTWAIGGVLAAPTPSAYMTLVAGTKSLSATLDRVRITTVNGTDTFDAGSVNIMYEG